MFGKCGVNKALLCPFSFAVALGITAGLFKLIWFGWMMYNGVPAGLEGFVGPLEWGNGFLRAFYCLITGFFFGLILALIYDLIAGCCKGPCCRRNGKVCNCCAGERKDTEQRKDVL